MKAVLTRAAVGDIADIARHIGRDSRPPAFSPRHSSAGPSPSAETRAFIHLPRDLKI